MASRKKTAAAEVPTDPPFDVENPAPEPAETPVASLGDQLNKNWTVNA